MDDECFQTINMNLACGRLTTEISIKDEPYSETESTHSSCPSSPQPTFICQSESSVDKYFADYVRTTLNAFFFNKAKSLFVHEILNC